jgi:hypothetical protein
VLYQLSYTPGLRSAVYPPRFAVLGAPGTADPTRRSRRRRGPASSLRRVRAPSQRRALGTLFVFLAAMFGGIAFAAASSAAGAAGWVVAFAAAAIGAWLLSLALRSLRTR